MATFKPHPPKHPAAPRRALAGGFWRWLHGFYQTGDIQPAGSRRHPPTAALRRARATR